MRKKFFVYGFLFVILIALDQITKAIFADRDFSFLFMKLHTVRNSGLSFGLNLGPINLAIIAIAFIALAWYIYKEGFSTSQVFIVSGALANVIDRIRLGYVRDFWDIGLGFTFNLADVFILLGLFALIKGIKPEKSNQEQIVE